MREADRLENALRRLDTGVDQSAGTEDDVADLVAVARVLGRSAPRAAPSAGQRAVAWARVRGALRETGRPHPGPALAWRPRLALRILAPAAVALLVAGLAVAASLPNGGVGEAIRGLFTEDADAKLSGSIVAVDGSSLVLETEDGRLVVTANETTLVTRGDGSSARLDDLAAGERAEVKGSRQPDGTIVASRIKLDP